MTPPRHKPLKRPAGGGFVGPCMASAPLEVIAETEGAAAAADLLKSARVVHAINGDEVLRETWAAAIHRAVRDTRGDESFALMKQAGALAGQTVQERHLPKRAQTLLRNAPWTISAWMLSRAMTQHAWVFSGSGTFTVADDMRFEIKGNPLIRGERSDRPLCVFHAAMFETIYRELVDPHLVCAETTCEAAGDDACRFSFGLVGVEPA